MTTRTLSKRLSAMAMLIALLASACGSSGSDSAAYDEVSDAADNYTDAPQATIAPEGSDGGTDTSGSADGEGLATDQEESAPGADPVGPLTAADLGRSIIFTGYVELEVENVAQSGQEAIEAIATMGGFVFGQNTTGGAEPRSEITFKVRPQDFDRALAVLGGVGEVRSQTVNASDVTERVVDLDSRISVAELGVERLRTALSETTNLEDFASVERLLLDRESELELMKGQLRTIQDQVDLATITLVLVQDRIQNNISLQITTYESHDGGASCTGSERFSFTEDTDYTLCFELINTGDQTLENIVITDNVLGIKADTKLIEVFGSLSEPLHSGQSVVLAYETTAERSLRPRTRVVASPTSGVEGEAPLPSVSAESNFSIDVASVDKAPGFGDGFESGQAIVAALWTAVQVTAGFVLPLLILLPFVWIIGKAIRWLSDRKSARDQAKRDSIPAPTIRDTDPEADE